MALGDKQRFLTPARLALVAALAIPLGACSTGVPGLSYDGVVQRGYQSDPATMNQLKNGLSKEKTLALLGVSEAQIESVSLGEEKPVCNEQSDDCWAQNRRADILYSGEF